MPKKSQLDKVINEVRLEIAALESKLKERRTFLSGIETALSSIPGHKMPKNYSPVKQTSENLRPLEPGLLKDAWDLVRKNGKMHVREILEALKIKPLTERMKNLSSQMTRNAKRGRAFRKVAPNTFEAI